MDRHFDCTACGKCCEGWLPLSISDALAHADKFPLFLLWSPLRPGAKSYDLTAELGIVLDLKKRKQAAVRIRPFSYVPPGVACSALAKDGKCTVHASKPQRCRTMPFSASRRPKDQADLLIPKPGWECDTGPTAPVVYADKKIIDPADFKAERAALVEDGKVLKPFARRMLDSSPNLRQDLEKMAGRSHGGHVIVNFSPLVKCLPHVDIFALAAQQLHVMQAMMQATQHKPQYSAEYKRYVACAHEWENMLA